MNPKKGLTTLTALLIMSATLLTGGIALHTSLRQSLASFSNADYAEHVEFLAQSCSYEAWYQLTIDRGYTGESLTLDTGTCAIAVTNEEKTYIIEVQAEMLPATAQYEFALEEQDGILTPIKHTHLR